MLQIKQLVPVDGIWTVFYEADDHYLEVKKVGCLALTEAGDVVAMVDDGHGLFEPVTGIGTFYCLVDANMEFVYG